MDAAGIARAHVCGVSIGGITALWLGVHAPDRVHRLVLANTAARIGSVEFWNERMELVRSGRAGSARRRHDGAVVHAGVPPAPRPSHGRADAGDAARVPVVGLPGLLRGTS